MKTFRILAAGCALLLLFSTSSAAHAAAQTRGRRTSSSASQRRRAAASSASKARTQSSQIVINSGRLRVVDEVKRLTQFVYLYGRASVNVEAAEMDARDGGAASAQAGGVASRSKESLRQSVRNVRDRLNELEFYFRTTPELSPFYGQISGVSAIAADAENKAAAGQFDLAGRRLLEAANRLSDVLLEM